MPKPSYDDKSQLIDDILAQKTYLPQSSMMKNLKRALTKLSYSDLANLQIILQCRINDDMKNYVPPISYQTL